MAKWYSYIFRENAYGFGIQIATFLGGVATTLILPNILGREGFGYFSLVVGIASGALIFSDFGLQLSALKFFPKWVKEGSAGHYFKKLLSVKILLAFLVGLLLFFGADAIAGAYRLPGLADGIRVGAAYFFFYSVYLFIENALIGLKMTRTSFWMSVVYHFSRVALPIAGFYLLIQSYVGAVAGLALAGPLVILIGVLLSRGSALWGDGEAEKGGSGELRSYMFYAALWYASVLAIGWSDVLILGFFKGVEDVSVYRVAWLWATATSFLFPFSNRIMIAAHATEGDERSKKLFDLTLRYAMVFAFLMVAGIVLVSGPFLDIVYRGQYSGAYPILVILSVLAIESSITALTSAVMLGKGGIKANTRVLVLTAVAQGAAVALLAPLYGAIGAAAGVAAVRLSSALYQLGMSFGHLSMPFDFAAIARPFACFALTVVLLWPLADHAGSFLSATALGVGTVALYGLVSLALKAVDVKEVEGVLRGATAK